MIIRLTDLFFVNAQAKDLQVEIMDENGNVITGFSREDCKEMNDLNSTKPVSYYTSPSPRDRTRSRMPSSA